MKEKITVVGKYIDLDTRTVRVGVEKDNPQSRVYIELERPLNESDTAYKNKKFQTPSCLVTKGEKVKTEFTLSLDSALALYTLIGEVVVENFIVPKTPEE